MTRPARGFERAVAAASIVALLLTVVWWRPGEGGAGIVVVLAVAWGTAPVVIDVACGIRRRADGNAPGTATVTTVVRLGNEPRGVASASIVLAAQAGPTAVIATAPEPLLDEVAALGVAVHVAPTFEAALSDAARSIATDAILIVSASAFPLPGAAPAAAARLGPGVGWVVGAAPSFNDDRFAPTGRELLGRRMRASARAAGVDIWEADATIVRTELVREVAFEPGRPWGTWLRTLAGRGLRGAEHPDAVALRAAPSDASRFWPSEATRQRAAAADLADATTSGPWPARLLAAGALLRALYAYPMVLWMLAPLLIGWSGAFPFRCHPLLFFALHALVAATRWAGSRMAYGVPLRPFDDIVRATYDAPGSLFALPSAVTRRIRPLRQPFPVQPLLWASVLLTVVTTISLVDRSATSDGRIDAVVGVGVIDLVALWVVAIRAVGTRAWDRTSYRMPVDLPATIDGHPGVTVDASPVGLAVAGHFEHLDAGATVTVSVTFESGTTLDVPALVTDRRRGAGVDVVGLALRAEGNVRARWIRELFRAAGVMGGAGRPPVTLPKGPRLRHTAREPAGTVRRVLDRVQIAVVTVTSVAVAGVLVAVFLGYSPLVVRSGSMQPAIAVGDVAVMDWVRVDDVAPGDVVSFQSPDAGVGDDVVTHRVRTVDETGGVVDVETRGDANTQSEFWSAPAGTLVGRMAFKIPKVGLVAIALGRAGVRAVLLATGLALAAAVAVVLLLRARTRVPTGSGVTGRP